METRLLVLDPRFKHTVPADVAEMDGKIVTVESWHELYPNTATKKWFPDDTRVGFVKEFKRDLPESELRRFGFTMCGLCHGSGRQREYGEEWNCPACDGEGASYYAL